MTARRRLGACALAMVACVLAPGATAPAWAQGEAWVKEHYTKYEHRIAMRDGVKLFTAVYVPKDASQAYPILLSRTPYSCRPYGTSNFKDQIGPSEAAARDRFIVVYQDVRGRWMSEGDYVNMRPHKAVKAGPKDVDESTDTWDTIDWLVKHVPRNNGKVGMWGISYPGFYVSAGMIDAHPRAQGRLAAGAHRRLVRGGRLPPQRRAVPAPRVQLLLPLRPAAPRADRQGARPLRLRHRGRLPLLPGGGPAREPGGPVPEGPGGVLEGRHGARDLRRLLEGAQPAPAPPGHQARGDDGRRLVRRRGPVRRARDLSLGREAEPRRHQHPS